MSFLMFLGLVGLVGLLWLRYHFVWSKDESEDRVKLENERLTDNHLVRAQVTSKEEVGDREVKDKDAWEGSFFDAENPLTVSAHLQFNYRDGNGKQTNRSVLVKQFDETLHEGLLIAHCELRDANRTFRFSRMKNCVDLETGECISSVRDFLVAKYEESPERSVDVFETDFLDVLKILYFVAKADGQFRKEEKAVVTDYVRTLVKDDRVTIQMVDNAIRNYDIPSLAGFKRSVGKVVRGRKVDLDSLIECCENIVNTQKTVHPSEKAALDYLEKKQEEVRA
ncbi:hypothetical protein ACJJIQ_23490 [Microbulbifer sp. ANSA003]|uniref:hypothetical protein n=1 Tax=Microbulbifer sp. ANSA003 TaxID=3243360 RepID=UPI0040416162